MSFLPLMDQNKYTYKKNTFVDGLICCFVSSHVSHLNGGLEAGGEEIKWLWREQGEGVCVRRHNPFGVVFNFTRQKVPITSGVVDSFHCKTCFVSFTHTFLYKPPSRINR